MKHLLLHVHGLSSCGMWAVVASGVGYSEACGVLVPQQEIKSTSPALQGRFLTTGPPRKSLYIYYIMSRHCQRKGNKLPQKTTLILREKG